MYCLSCGEEVRESASFCEHCGTDISEREGRGSDETAVAERSESSDGNGEETDIRHITGDYYYDHGAYADSVWLAAAIFCIILPPLGLFMLGWMVVGSLADAPGEEVVGN